MDLLAGHRLHLMFGARRVEVDPPADPPGEPHPLRLDRANHPSLDVHLGGEAASAVLDTGAGITVVDLALARRHPAHFRAVGRSTGTDATGATWESPIFALAGAAIGGRPFPPHPVAGVDLTRVNAGIESPMALVLGYSTLSRADWWLDFPGRRWMVTRLLGPG